MDLAALIAQLRQFVAERDWAQFHDPKNLAMLVGSEAGELVAEYRWVRSEDADTHSRDPAARARIAAEIGAPIHPVVSSGGSDGSFAGARGVPTLDGLGPICFDTCSRREKIVIASLAERGSLFGALIDAISAGPSG